MRVLVTGGGTGGHIFPAIAVCEALKRLDTSGDLLYIGGSSGMETQIVPAAGIPFQAVTARKMPARPSLNTVRGLAALFKGYCEARTCICAFRANVVVGTGGYVAAATVLAAAKLGIPALILENNMIPGRTNLWLARSAKKICVSFQETMKRFPEGRCVLTGLPLREGIVAPADLTKQKAREQFDGLVPDRFTVLVIGGSQGARAINGMIVAAAPLLIKQDIQVLHQVGPKNMDEAALAANSAGLLYAGSGYVMRPFIDTSEMPAALRCADVIVCRGGISTISEATANGLPALIVPLPTAYADHQTANARAVEALGAALCRPESAMTGNSLAEEIAALQMNSGRLTDMARASVGIGRPDAADNVAKLALSLVN
jgi:UDP-N-acetylglucosamine--N-acetylmuramyl-(pentapeptide) pyrophosphoryl-undecaprenol N-acetylglucosamine transferase